MSPAYRRKSASLLCSSVSSYLFCLSWESHTVTGNVFGVVIVVVVAAVIVIVDRRTDGVIFEINKAQRPTMRPHEFLGISSYRAILKLFMTLYDYLIVSVHKLSI